MVRVLIVDDSATTRQALATILESDPDIQVVGEAADGIEGVRLTAQLMPDVITMDVHMPRMDGNAATKEIMSRRPTPIVVVTSISQSELMFKGIDILRSGALEIVQKPSTTAPGGMEAIRSELLGKVKTAAQVKIGHQESFDNLLDLGRSQRENGASARRRGRRRTPHSP